MQIVNIDNKEKLNNFVGSQKYSQFLQSFEWGEFQSGIREKIWRIGVEQDGKLVAVATITKKRLPMGKYYFYCPRGPIMNDEVRMTNYELIFEEIQKIAKDEGVMFLRFEPTFDFRLSTFDFQKTLDVQPSKTLILDLAKTEEELLKGMHEKTRYNIRLAEKKGVKVIEAGPERFEEFWNLLDQTSGRDKFRSHGRDYYKAMLEADKNLIKLFFAEYDSSTGSTGSPQAGSGQRGKPIAAGIFSFFGGTATYLHGGSANEFRNVMAPYLLQWCLIKKAKEQNYKYYDFYGIDDKKWPGVTKFKKGFGGEELNCPGTFDLVFDKGWYNIYKMIRKARRTF